MNLYCTGDVSYSDFPDFLKAELGEPRRNINLFSTELNELFGTEYCTLVNSGSSANLVAAMMVKELRPNHNIVLCAGFTFPTTISSYSMQGFDIRLVDVEEGGFNIDPDRLRVPVGDIAAIVVTHFLGFPAQLDKLREYCSLHGILLVQDACETMNLKYDGKSIHQYGDIVTHSFYHPHHMSSYGGGAVINGSKKMHMLAESITHWGRSCTCHFNPDICPNNGEDVSPEAHNFTYARTGVNVEMSELNACFGRFQLQTYVEQETTRLLRYEILYDRLSKIPNVKVWENTLNVSPFVFPIQVSKHMFRPIVDAILADKLFIRTLMGGGIHLQPGFSHLANVNLKNTEYMSETTFFCGIHQSLTDDDFAKIVDILEKNLNG